MTSLRGAATQGIRFVSVSRRLCGPVVFVVFVVFVAFVLFVIFVLQKPTRNPNCIVRNCPVTGFLYCSELSCVPSV